MFDSKTVFAEEFARAIAEDVERSGYPVSQWFKSGPASPELDIDVWSATGPRCVDKFTDWFEGSGAQVWIAPDGRPGIELELSAMFGSVPVTGRPDLVADMGALVVVDLKTGRKVPSSYRQLGLYASLVELAYGPEHRPRYGAYYMARGTGPRGCDPEDLTYFQRPVPLDGEQYSVRYLTEQFERFAKARDQGLFLANPGDYCRTCGVAGACPEAGGSTERAIERGN
jgi:hypothetical protein